MEEVYKMTAVAKEMEEKHNMKIDSIENEDRESVGNTVTQEEQSCETETAQRKLRSGKVTGMKEQENEKIERDDGHVSDRRNVNGLVGIEHHVARL